MSEPIHTPGPWLVNPFCAQVDDSAAVPICQLLWPTDERSERETMQNAKLIMAAPDMLAALEIGVRYIETIDATMAFTSPENRPTAGDLNAMKAAIAKAKGEA